jgi:hypothetical protein
MICVLATSCTTSNIPLQDHRALYSERWQIEIAPSLNKTIWTPGGCFNLNRLETLRAGYSMPLI